MEDVVDTSKDYRRSEEAQRAKPTNDQSKWFLSAEGPILTVLVYKQRKKVGSRFF